MSSIAGIYHKNGESVPENEISSLLNGLHHWEADSRDQLTEGPVGMGQLMLLNTPESHHEKLPFRDPDSGLVITADVRIDNREELIELLNLHSPGDIITDGSLVVEAYKKYGSHCTDHLVGAFAFAIYDPIDQTLFCARDHMGFKPFFYYNDPYIFIFSTEIKGIKAHHGIRLTINELFIADALSTLRSEKDQTLYNEILRLPPAHQMIVTGDKIKIQRYWELNPRDKLKLASEKEYIEAFREKLEEAVRCRLRSDYPVGAELSGGIDSSAVVSLAAQKGPVKTFSHALPQWAKDKQFPYKDETEHSQQVIDCHSIRDRFFVTGEKAGLLELLRKGLKLHEGVMQGTLSEVFDPLYQKVEEENCRTLLSGYGGDEMVTSQGPGYLMELAAGFRITSLWKEIRKKKKNKGFLPVIKSFGKIMLYAQWQRFQPRYKTPGWAHDIFYALAIDAGFLRETNLKERFYRKKKLPASGSTRMRQYRRINYDYMPQRLEYCAIKAQTRKIEYRYPLLDKRLVEFYLSLPSHMKAKNGYGRYIIRKALEGMLPPEIQWRTDKTGTVVPSIFIKYKHEEQQMRELIEKARNSPIKHYVDYDRMGVMLERLANYDENTDERINPQAFQSSLMLLMWQLDQLEESGE